ncbi:TolB family protein [Portibacter marinus]|uniref:TolB family protein n=1 Tax=Portibacter marinus TaxID=2898660 RepID=UPI001F2BB976|nr:hypothetical protein [Portibacter marinus]
MWKNLLPYFLMKLKWSLFIALILLIQCSYETSNYRSLLGVNSLPNEEPIPFKSELVPKGKLIHRGIVTPELDAYYFTLSSRDFSHFDIYFIERVESKWSEPQKASFNSDYNDHGMSFSPDGNTIYFSSTRPVENTNVEQTWHLWKTEKQNGTWIKPSYVDIPNLRQKLTSHPSITKDGTLYYHSSNLDYSEMDIYYSKQVDGKFQPAQKVALLDSANLGRTTPYVSADGSFLIYASVNKSLNLMISYKDNNDKWTQAEALNKKINTNGQGNPYVTPNNKYLFFATEKDNNWVVKWARVEPREFL